MMITQRISLAPRNTFRVGGVASYFVCISHEVDIPEVIRYQKANQLALLVMGEGSNLLISDSGFDGLVVQIQIKGIEIEKTEAGTLLTAGAGEHWDDLVKFTVEQGLWGLENLSGIPGSVGGTPIQNVGAYGSEVGDHILWVEAYDIENEKIRRFTNAECLFGYRDSFFKTPQGRNFIIVRVAFLLSDRQNPKVQYRDLAEYFKNDSSLSLAKIRDAVISIRAKKFPDLAEYGCAGSFFKNPIISKEMFEKVKMRFPNIPGYPLTTGMVKIPAAYLIEQLGWKGKREGNVGTYQNHSLVVVNFGEATSNEIQTFAEKIIKNIFDETGITIEPEVRVV